MDLRKTLRIVLPVITVTLASLLMGTTTSQADEEVVTCTVVDTSPDEVVIGISPKRVQFDVGTDCDDDHPVSWGLSAEGCCIGGGPSWLMLRNWRIAYGEKFSYVVDPDGYFTIDPVHGHLITIAGQGGNAMAGTRRLSASAFYDANANSIPDEPVSYMASSFNLKRAVTFGASFDAYPEPRKYAQKLNLKAKIQRADWDSGTYKPFSYAPVAVQFRPNGSDEFSTVKYIYADRNGALGTSVRVTYSGSWRFRFIGDNVSGAADSKSDMVMVR